MIEVNWRPEPPALRTFGLVGLFVFPILAALIWWRQSVFGFALEPGTAAGVAWVLVPLGALTGALAWLAPKALLPMYVAMTAVTLPIGIVVSKVILGAIYFLVVTPIALFFKVIGRDPLHRAFDREAATYWIPRRPVQDVERYFRQY